LESAPTKEDPTPPTPLWRRVVSFLVWLFIGRRTKPAVDAILELPEFDAEAIMAELRIAEKARENGRHEIPGSNDTELDGPQSLIVNRIDSALYAGKHSLQAHLTNLTRRIRACDVSGDCAAARELPERLATELGELVHDYTQRVEPMKSRLTRLEAQLTEFRQRFGITAEPAAPASHWLHFGTLMLIVLLESALNGTFFARADELGLLGGVQTAMGIALVNVLASFFFGRGAAWLAGRRPGFRAVGVAASIAFFGWLLAYNWAVAHVRDLLEVAEAISGYQSVVMGLRARMLSPFAFEDVRSWLLLALGMVFSLAAFFDGIRWDDPNFGYSARWRDVKDAREDYFFEWNDLRQRGRALLNRRRSDLSDLIARVQDRIGALANDVAQKEHLLARAQNFFDYAQSSCNTMLHLYRDLNRQSRTTPPPAYFQSPWLHPDPDLLDADVGPDRAHLKDQRVRARELGEIWGEVETALESRLTGFLSRVDTMIASAGPS